MRFSAHIFLLFTFVILGSRTWAEEPTAGLVGTWVAFQDDDASAESPDETLFFYPDGTLRIKGKPHPGLSYRIVEDQVQFLLNQDTGPKVIATRVFMLEADLLKLKNTEKGYMHYRRSKEGLPPLPSSSPALAAYEFGPLSLEKPGNWEAVEKAGALGSQVMIHNKNGSAQLMVTHLIKDGVEALNMENVARETALSVAKRLGIPEDTVEIVAGPFYNLEGSYIRIANEVEGTQIEIKVKAILLEPGKLLSLNTLSIAGSPDEVILETIFPTLKINGKPLR